MVTMNLGKNIKKYREKAGLSRAKLAQKCGNLFSANHLWRVEAGLVKNPGIEMVKEIAKVLNSTLDNLLYE
jgi:transcriptional regulator with XRE-family HTH domain